MKTRMTIKVSTPGIDEQISPYRTRLESCLDQILPAESSIPESLHQAMRYATLNAGKRLRACLLYLTGEMYGASLEDLDLPAAAVDFDCEGEFPPQRKP